MIEPSEIPSAVAELRKEFNTEKTASKEWRKGQLTALLTLLKEGREELCRGMHEDLHKSHFEGYMTEINMVEMECAHALAHLDEWMKPERVTTNLFNVPSWGSYIYNDPLGVVAILGAWNYNVVLTLGPLVGAIAGGNCVMVKPGNYSSNSGLAMAKLIDKYMDTRCIKVVLGNREVNAALLNERYDLIFCTGSPLIGKIVAKAAAENLTPCVLELGGKSPCIVDKTADIPVTVSRMLHGATLNGGQTCVRPDTYFFHEDVADAVINELKTRIVEFFGKDQQKTEFYGRIINDSSFKRLMGLVDDARDKIVFGGNSDPSDRYIQPTIFDFGNDMQAFANSKIMGEEVFGPLFPVYRYRDLEEVIQFIREREKPLALYCFTSDYELAEEVLTRTFSGGALINDCCVHLANGALPFGGVGNSGYGNYHGHHSFKTFTHQKAVMTRPTIIDAPIRYPPYSNLSQTALGILQMPVWSIYMDKLMQQVEPKNAAILAMLLYIAKLKFGKSSKL